MSEETEIDYLARWRRLMPGCDGELASCLFEEIESTISSLLSRLAEVERERDEETRLKLIAQHKNSEMLGKQRELEAAVGAAESRLASAREALKVAEGALEFYAHEANWSAVKNEWGEWLDGPAVDDDGSRARKALAHIRAAKEKTGEPTP